MIEFTEIESNGEDFELFARDFLEELGFEVISPPNRGADSGKDILVQETATGILDQTTIKWLVSCKHKAHSKRSVTEGDEQNIVERLETFGADRFLGFYSTLPSSGLGNRLDNLRDKNAIAGFRILDGKAIENKLITKGYSHLVSRYFPNSYRAIRPIHLLFDEYLPLKCRYCSTDILEAMFADNYTGLIAYVSTRFEKPKKVLDVYFACKGECDRKIAQSFENREITTTWEDIGDLIMPTHFLRWIITTLNNLHDNTWDYSPEAFKKEKYFIAAVAQRVFREMTEKERNRTASLFALAEYGL